MSQQKLDGKNVLVTGGLGFIGSNLARRCLELGAKVIIYDCLDPHSGGNLFNVQDIKKEIEIVYGDILNYDEVSKKIVDMDILFNCAASTSHPFSMKEPWIDLDVNSRGVINLLEAAKRFNRQMKFIHIGTSTQLGPLQFRPATEAHPEFPTDIYSANKSASEKYVLIYGRAYNMPVVSVRFPNVFGPRASIHSSDFTFVNYFIGLALRGRDITVYGEGNQLRNVIYVDDCVAALLAAAENQAANGEVFFAVGDEHFSVAQIAEKITSVMKKGGVKYVSWPGERKATEIGDAIISNEKAKKLLGWKPVDNFQSGLVKTKEYYNRCLDRYVE
jgi:UDP-glucose 4-epimerase